MTMEFGALMTSATALMNLAKAAIDAHDDAKAKAAITDANQKLFELSMELLSSAERLSSLQADNHTLNAKLIDLEAQIKDKAKYQLVALGKNGRALLLVDHATGNAAQPVTYFCQHCHDKGIKSILREYDRSEWNGAHWACVENDQHSIYM